MTNLNLLMILLSFALLLLCMLAPLRKSAAVQKCPSLKMLFKPHGIYGVLLLIVSFLHGILSGNKPAMMTGKAAWLCLPSCSIHVAEREGDCCMAETAQDLFRPSMSSDRSPCSSCRFSVRHKALSLY